MKQKPDDRIFLSTRIVSAAVIPFLVLAFIILYFFPETSAERFAWRVQPDVMAIYIGSGYIGGAYLFIHALFGRHWHRVAAGFPAIATFTVSMLLATIVHWNQTNIYHFPFQVWLVLYIITPILVPLVWLHNRQTDPGTLASDDIIVPYAARWAMRLLGAILIISSIVSFIFPDWLLLNWPWSLSLLSARLLAGWGALLGVGGLVIANDRRWSAWQVGMESIAIWHLLFLAGAFLHPQDFTNGNLANWYMLGVVAILIAMAGLYTIMAVRRRQKLALPQHAG